MDKFVRHFKSIIMMISLVIILGIDRVYANTSYTTTLTYNNDQVIQTIPGTGYNINGTTIEFTKPGTYRINGSSNEGNIIIKKGTSGVVLILDNLSLTSSRTAPIVVKKSEEGQTQTELTIKLVGWSTLTDNEDPDNEYSTDPDISGLYEGAGIKIGKGSKLNLGGYGHLKIKGNTKNGIKGGEQSVIHVDSGYYDIVANNHGIANEGPITIDEGVFSIEAEAEGIKISADEGGSTEGLNLTINGGGFDINTGQDGIQVLGNIYINNNPTIKIYSILDAIQTRANFYMTSGTLDLRTFEGSNPISFAKDLMSAKGIKASPKDEDTSGATNLVSITGGEITIDSSDDAIHSEGSVIITRGTLNLKSGDDAVHANTKLTIGTQGGLERDPEITVLDSYEGLEAGNLYIYSGKIYVIADDDGINAAGGASNDGDEENPDPNPDEDPGSYNPDTNANDLFALYIYGGEVFVNANGDGLDSNGSIYLYGGTQIIYHEDADGSNSSLDRDGRLIIDGATFFSAGGIAESGIVSEENGGIGSSQKYLIDNTTYPANTKIAILDENGGKIFNEQIIQKSKYMIYTSPTLTEGSSISSSGVTIEEEYSNPFNHTWQDPVIIQEATEDTPGIMSYSCIHNVVTERKTYFFHDELTFNIYNKTNQTASVTINDGTGNRTETTDFTVHDNTGVLTIASSKELELIVTELGNTTEFAVHNPTSVTGDFGDPSNPAIYTYKIENTSSFDMYVVLKGDVNLDGVADENDSIAIRNSKLSTTNPLYEPLSIIGEIIGDVNDDGLVTAADALLLKNNFDVSNRDTVNNLELVNDHSTISDALVVDGVNNGTVTVELKATADISFTALEAYFSPSSEFDIDHPYFVLLSLEKVIDNGLDTIDDVDNGLFWLIKPTGYNVNNGDVIYRATFSVDKDTPTGYYPIHLGVSAITAPGSDIGLVFPISTTVRINGAINPYIALFETDSGVASIDAFNKQEYTTPSETDVDFAYARNSDTGIIDLSGDGQINFRINLEEGYILKSMTIENIQSSPSDTSDHYKNLKGPGDTKAKDVYRLTKVSGDLKVIIETKLDDKFVATFTKDSHVTGVDIFYTKAYENDSSLAPDEFNVIQSYIRDKDSGNIDISGSGQVNFRVNVEDGYYIDKVKVTGVYEEKKENNNGDGNYKITKVASDLNINIKTKAKTPVTLDVTGYEDSYVYTGKKIEPAITVKVHDSDPEITLVEGTDYNVEYKKNKDVGNNTAKIIITSLTSSKYSFEETTKMFSITAYPLTIDNVDAPNSIYYTGETLTPNVIVSANNKVLTKDEEYTISYTNLDGNVGDTIVATVTGIGNFSGVVDNIEILIKNKGAQDLAFSETELTKTYGENYTLAATRSTGDGTITYESSNQDVATVDNSGNVTLVGSGDTVITARASETTDYAPAIASYTLTVNKAPLTINDVKVANKNYDGNTNATVIRVNLEEQVNSDNLVKGTDFTATGEFDDEEVGVDKEVVVTVTLSEDTAKKYSLNENVVQSTARITLHELTEECVTVEDTSYTYDGNPKEPSVTVKVGDTTLVEGTDYDIEYVDNTNAGTAKVLIKGKGNYFTEDNIEKEFTIGKLAINPVIGVISDQQYTGSEIKPELNVAFETHTLEAGTDYIATYTNNINVGTSAHVSITPAANGNYTFDSVGQNFNIVPHTLTDDDITLEYTKVKGDGTSKEPSVTVVVNGTELVKDTDYTVTYDNNTNVGTADVTITATSGNYTGSQIVHFEITEKEVLTISGINDNQAITYTGNPVALAGTITVSANSGNITASDLTIKYYDATTNTEIDKPTDVGNYYVIYSYNQDDYVGEFKVNFEITKKESTNPNLNNLVGVVDRPLSTVTVNKTGLVWDDATTIVTEGRHSYPATYTENNDTKNYTTINLNVPVTGKTAVNITTAVSGTGGTITESQTDVLDGEVREIVFTPDEGYVLDKVTVNGKAQAVTNNRMTITAAKNNINIVAVFKRITNKLKVVGNNVDANPYGLLNVDYNDSKTITIKPAHGYVLKSILVNGTESIDKLEDDKLTINNITEEINIVIYTSKISYQVIEGAGQEVEKGNEATFKINADYSVFNPGGKVYVDDKLVNSDNYTHRSGSTVVTLKKELINVLADGEHTFKVVFTDGGDASTTFTILKTTHTVTPITGDDISSNVWLLVISSIVLLLIIIYVIIRIIKKNKNKKKA